MKRVFCAKRKCLKRIMSASVKIVHQTTDHVWNIQQEQRQKLRQEYFQQLFSLIQDCKRGARNLQEEEENMASLLQQLQNASHHFEAAPSQRMSKVRMLFQGYLKSVEDLEENHQTILAREHYELVMKMAALQTKLMMETLEELTCYSTDPVNNEAEPE
ncbi:synaptonemal complex protein 3-like [Otolemur garnettii]|uniref:synaptonemal complex protein 3-like n=1 Tax=Otolemur garnettii TaxID=30611 RepID=UPI000C7F2D5E|nr:synaptonemal complex protein 3-like [Otolemur garnettii]